MQAIRRFKRHRALGCGINACVVVNALLIIAIFLRPRACPGTQSGALGLQASIQRRAARLTFHLIQILPFFRENVRTQAAGLSKVLPAKWPFCNGRPAPQRSLLIPNPLAFVPFPWQAFDYTWLLRQLGALSMREERTVSAQPHT